MKTLALALAALLMTAASAQAELIGRVELVSTGTTSPLTGTVFDVYHVFIDNETGPSLSLEVSFPGIFLNELGDTLKDTTELSLGGTVPETFVVIPENAMVLNSLFTDTDDLLEGSYRVLTESTPAVPLGSSVVAVLSVPSRIVPDTSSFSANLFLETQTAPVRFIPEPSTIALLFIASGIVYRRRIR